METTTTATVDIVNAYYGSWTNGAAAFDRARLEQIFDADLEFEGSIAGKRRGAAVFIGGLQRFVEGLQKPIDVQARVESGSDCAVLYEAEMPGGPMRFAEFFHVEDGRIRSLKLLYDASQYRALGGR